MKTINLNWDEAHTFVTQSSDVFWDGYDMIVVGEKSNEFDSKSIRLDGTWRSVTRIAISESGEYPIPMSLL